MLCVNGIRTLAGFFGLFMVLAFTPLAAADDDEVLIWQALRSGEGVAMIRHALAPGTGDPANFDVNDCSTQRNLSDTGREQAKAIGQLFKDAGIGEPRLFTSQWCRCRETAELMDLGEVTEQPLLNSFFRQRDRETQQTLELQAWLSEQEVVTDKPLVLVTHQVNITGLSGVFPSSGEIVVIRHPAGEAIEVLGTIETD